MLDGRERDGLFDDGEIIHIIEATVSQKLDKVRTDLQKSVDLVRIIRREQPEKLVKIWIVTSREPTADQQSAVPDYRKKAKCPIEMCGFRHFSSKLIDSASYLDLRTNYAFGSVRNPADDRDINVPTDEYVSLDIVNRRTQEVVNLDGILKLISDSSAYNIVMLGDYGSGKSMTLRQAFFALRVMHLKSELRKFPVYLNLRDHFGQSDPAEALIRHGRSIGLPDPNQLVAAWRAGYVILFLDGFDEVSSTRLVRGSSKIKLARRQAVGLVRAFVDQSPYFSKVIISGREHYFDSQDEMVSALGVSGGDVIFSLSEFTQRQISDFLSRKGVHKVIPDWLPSRPLLLGYLVVCGLFEESSPLTTPMAQEDGWNYILDRVCEREARQIDPILIEPKLVREFIERLASKARNTISRRGPVFIQDINAVFERVFDMPPDEKAETLILRLPGLTASTGAESAREFIDDDFVDACRSGDVARYAQNPFDEGIQDLENATTQMGSLGCRIAASRLRNGGATAKQMTSALENACKHQAAAALSIDLVQVIQELGFDYLGDRVYIRDGFFDFFEVYVSPKLSNIYFQESYFERMEMDLGAVASSSPKFLGCQIEELTGPISRFDIPDGIMDKATEVARFTQEANTNADILDLDMPLSVRVLLTVLRKLFVQSGRGRRENAFFRGLDTNARAYVEDILSLLESFDFAHPHKINGPVVWLQNRAKSAEAMDILSAPQTSTHRLIQKTRLL